MPIYRSCHRFVPEYLIHSPPLDMRRLRASSFSVTVSPQARASYLALAYIGRTAFSTSALRQSSGQYHRSDFSGQGFTGIYEPGQPTRGPLGGASLVGAPRIVPKALKEHLDQYVVGQERAKKKLSTAIYNHYQLIQELERREQELEEMEAQAHRREMGHRHPVEGSLSSLCIPWLRLLVLRCQYVN